METSYELTNEGFGTKVTGLGVNDWVEPLPFPELEGPEFPISALPQDLAEIVEAHAEGLQVPPGMSATLALGTLCAVLGGKAVVRPRPDWREPVNEFTITVLPPSERKSAAFRGWLAPIEQKEKELMAIAVPAIEEATASLDVLRQRLSSAKKTAANASSVEAREEAEKAVQELARQVAQCRIPTLSRLLADDATPEAIFVKVTR